MNDTLAIKKGSAIKEIALGASTYKNLVINSTVFVDKSLLIRDFLSSWSRVLLVTCPRRWGKSINMNMIKTFLEIEVDENGNKLNKTITSNYKLFAKGQIDFGNKKAELEKKLNISQCQDIVDEYQGEYPVISVDFKNINGENFEEILAGVKSALYWTFVEHEYLSESSKLSKKEKDFFKKYTDKTKLEELKVEDVKEGLKFLSKLLYRHFSKQVYLLMDEYDAPFNKILWKNNFHNSEIKKTLDLFSGIMGTVLKSNEYLEKGLITGIFRIAKADMFSNLNNIKEYNFLNNNFAQHYGFTQKEVNLLFAEYEISHGLAKKAEEWYDGYRIPKLLDFHIYNPWSIVNFLAEQKDLDPKEKRKAIKSYWEESGNINFIKELFKKDEIRETVQKLIKKDDVKINLQGLRFDSENLLELKRMLNSDNYQVDPQARDLFFSYLLAAGYLTISEEEKNISGDDDRICSVSLPNKEVASELAKKVVSYYQKIYRIDPRLFSMATDELNRLFKSEDNNTSEFKNVLEELFKKIKFIDIRNDVDRGIHGNEEAVHTILNCIGIQLNNVSLGNEIWYKKECRADILLINSTLKIGVIVEVKYQSSAKKALEQAKKYKPLLEKHPVGIEKIKYVGLNVDQNKEISLEIEQFKCNNKDN